VFAGPDPRDAEIARLRTALNGYQKRTGDDLRRGGELVERIRKALRESHNGTCTMASMAGVVGPVGRLCDVLEVEVAQHDRTKADRDDALRHNGELATERNEAREEWKRADAKVTRLRHETNERADEVLRRGAGMVERIVQGVLRATEARLAATPAEPRRWVAGDAEPEIGTTLRSTTARTYTRRSDGSWHFLACPEGCPLPALWWTDLLAAAPLVEVVGTDG
jgi:hypothetical protein